MERECEFQVPEELQEYVETKLDEYMEILEENEDNKDFCFPCSLRELILDCFIEGHNQGRQDLALAISQSMDSIIYEDLEDECEE